MSDNEEKETSQAEGSEKGSEKSSETINVKVLGHDTSVIQFRIKRSANFGKLMKIYCERLKLQMNAVRFLFDGERVLKSDTPASIDMNEGDTLEVMMLQEGGCSSRTRVACRETSALNSST